MTIALKYTVHSAAVVRVPVEAIVNGHTVIAEVDQFVLELVGYDTDHGHTYRVPPGSAEELAALREKYQPGVEVPVTLG